LNVRILAVTAEVKYYLDLSDILAVQLECCNPKCQVHSSFPVSKLTRMPHECPHCKADWVFPDTDEERAISAFLASLGRVAGALKGRTFKLSLEVDYEEAEAPI
jgi:hypothetical protein